MDFGFIGGGVEKLIGIFNYYPHLAMGPTKEKSSSRVGILGKLQFYSPDISSLGKNRNNTLQALGFSVWHFPQCLNSFKVRGEGTKNQQNPQQNVIFFYFFIFKLIIFKLIVSGGAQTNQSTKRCVGFSSNCSNCWWRREIPNFFDSCTSLMEATKNH